MSTEEVMSELEVVRRRNGGILRPADVVEYARDPDTALHAQFEWDDGKAAEQYRLEQARRVIRCVVRVVGDDAAPMRMYVSLVDDRQAGDSYRTLDDVAADEELRQRLVSQALREADSWRVRYERFTELEPVVRAIKRAQRRQGKRKPELVTA